METEIPVRDIMTRPVITVGADLDILSAARKMGSANVGSLIITAEGKTTGILTERDLVKKVLAEGKDPRAIKVIEIMSSPVVSIEPDASLREAAALMLRSGVKRLPVIANGRLVGIITDTDLASGSSVGMNDILSDLLEMHRESVHFETPQGLTRGICEVCGMLSDSLENVDGQLLCWSCRDGKR